MERFRQVVIVLGGSLTGSGLMAGLVDQHYARGAFFVALGWLLVWLAFQARPRSPFAAFDVLHIPGIPVRVLRDLRAATTGEEWRSFVIRALENELARSQTGEQQP